MEHNSQLPGEPVRNTTPERNAKAHFGMIDTMPQQWKTTTT